MINMKHSDWKELVERAQTRDAAAFAMLVERFEDRAMAIAWAWLADTESAREVCQESFLDAWLRLPELREPLAFPAWLRRIVLKHCDRLTRRGQPMVVPDAEADDLAAAGGPGTDAAQHERNLGLRLAIEDRRSSAGR